LYPEGPATGHLDTRFLGFPPSSNKCWVGSQVQSCYSVVLMQSSRFSNIVFKHPVALIYHLFHVIYFRLQCNLLSHFLLTTCFGRTRPSSGVSNSLKLLPCMVCPTSRITCECDVS
jgi:hypothetical protein